MQTRKMISLLLVMLMLAMLVSACKDGADSTAADSSSSTTSTTASGSDNSPAMDKPEMEGQGTDESMDMADAMPPTAGPGTPGTMAPDFTLTDMSGSEHRLADYLADGKTVVLEWFNPGCSVVHYYYQETTNMVDTYSSMKEQHGDDLVWLAVISQNPEGRGGSDEEVNTAIADWNIPYPVLRDGEGVVGKSYGAEATPAMYVISPDGMIAYNGSVDEYQKGGDLPPVGTNFVVQAVNAVRNGESVAEPRREAIG